MTLDELIEMNEAAQKVVAEYLHGDHMDNARLVAARTAIANWRRANAQFLADNEGVAARVMRIVEKIDPGMCQP